MKAIDKIIETASGPEFTIILGGYLGGSYTTISDSCTNCSSQSINGTITAVGRLQVEWRPDVEIAIARALGVVLWSIIRKFLPTIDLSISADASFWGELSATGTSSNCSQGQPHCGIHGEADASIELTLEPWVPKQTNKWGPKSLNSPVVCGDIVDIIKSALPL
jgi:hypothetical protein